jgi:hypothetical protein
MAIVTSHEYNLVKLRKLYIHVTWIKTPLELFPYDY